MFKCIPAKKHQLKKRTYEFQEIPDCFWSPKRLQRLKSSISGKLLGYPIFSTWKKFRIIFHQNVFPHFFPPIFFHWNILPRNNFYGIFSTEISFNNRYRNILWNFPPEIVSDFPPIFQFIDDIIHRFQYCNIENACTM